MSGGLQEIISEQKTGENTECDSVKEKAYAVTYGSTAETKEEAKEDGYEMLKKDISLGVGWDLYDKKVYDDGPYTVELNVYIHGGWMEEVLPSPEEVFTNAENFQEIAIYPEPHNCEDHFELTECPQDNPYEQAFPDEVEKLEEDFNKALHRWEKGEISRPTLSEELLSVAQKFRTYAKNTEQVTDQ